MELPTSLASLGGYQHVYLQVRSEQQSLEELACQVAGHAHAPLSCGGQWHCMAFTGNFDGSSLLPCPMGCLPRGSVSGPQIRGSSPLGCQKACLLIRSSSATGSLLGGGGCWQIIFKTELQERERQRMSCDCSPPPRPRRCSHE